jgi:dCTP deaminase
MILTDREIQIALNRKLFTIEPPPIEEAYSSTTVDLTLDKTVSEYPLEQSGAIKITIDPTHKEYNHEETLAKLTTPIEISENGYLFNPKHLILAWTREYVELPAHARIAARIEGKSSLARLGIGVHITAPIIHAGFNGQIRLEMINNGVFPILLKPGMRICQLCFEQTLGTPEKGYKGKFSGQSAKLVNG